MPRIEPFAGIRFDARRVGKLDDVVAPPYDVISDEQERRLRERSPYNVIWIDLPREGGGDRYLTAGRRMGSWLREGALLRESAPALYVLSMTFEWQGASRTLTGIMGAVRLEPLGGGVLPHEETLAGPKADRLALMRTTHANLSPIYGIYSDPSRTQTEVVDTIRSDPPIVKVSDDDGVSSTLWVTTDADHIAALGQAISPHTIYIADGHHRYKTALTYREERRHADGLAGTEMPERSYDFTLMYLVNMADGGLATLPVHRLVRNLGDVDAVRVVQALKRFFDVEEASSATPDRLAAELAERGAAHPAFALYLGSAQPARLLILREGVDVDRLVLDAHSPDWKHLDVTVLHRLVVESALGVPRHNVENQRDVAFTKDAADAMRRVDEGAFQLALFVNPTPVSAVQAIAQRGETMPQKSTYFYPKPLSGLVMNPLG